MKSKGQIQIFAILLILITSCILVYEGYQRYLTPEKPAPPVTPPQAQECTNDNDCEEDEICKQQMCRKITCGYCEYLENRQCKSYQCCSEYDCDDNNPKTPDKCLSPRTKDSKCEHEVAKKCADGTISRECSGQKPLYCENGNLINNCNICGCSSEQHCQTDGSCVSLITQCSSGLCCDVTTGKFRPKTHKCQENFTTELGCPWGNEPGANGGKRSQDRYCSGNSVDCVGETKWNDWSLYDDCGVNETCVNGVCTLLRCSDKTLYGECSETKPLYCDKGVLINKCSACSCFSGYQCQSDRSCIAPPSPTCKCKTGPCCDGCNFKVAGSQPIGYADDTDGFCSGINTEATICANSATSICYVLTSDYYCNGTDANMHVSYALKDTCGVCKYCQENKLTCNYYDTNTLCGVTYCPIDACSNPYWLNYPETCVRFCGGSGACNDCSCIAVKICSKNCAAECDASSNFSSDGTTCYYNCQTTVNLTNSCKFQSSAPIDDANSCPIDTCTTSGITHTNITSCINNDGCCPTNCGFLTDNDCSFLVNPKVMLIIFNPIIESQGNKKLTELQGWGNPDQLTQQYIEDVKEVSGGSVNYVIKERVEVDDIPKKEDGFDYTDESYLQCWYNHSTCHSQDTVDYNLIIEQYNVCAKLNNGSIDELWIWGGPWFGYWEANQAGTGAFDTNGPVVSGTSCNKILNIMGFNYERGVGEMLEDLGHRIEGTMRHVFGSWSANNPQHDWDRFTLIDKNVPGQAVCGNVHYGPNSISDYDWGNMNYVSSSCDDWYNYPNLTGLKKQTNCVVWGCEIRGHHKWWLKHLPRASGQKDGKWNNWWRYVVDYNNI